MELGKSLKPNLAKLAKQKVERSKGYRGFTKGITGSYTCWADRHCWISQRNVNIRFTRFARKGLQSRSMTVRLFMNETIKFPAFLV